jgi:GH15 family glucan-1,4-alpha-glucosidase
LPFIKIPTIIIWGDKDEITTLDDGYFINKQIKNSKLIIIPGAGHDLNRKQPEIVAEKIIENVINLPHDNGLFYQRYNPDGQPDPHGWCNNNDSRQLDQDALGLVAISHFPSLKKDSVKVLKHYNELLKRIKSKNTSTDVWEQKRGYFFYTTASLIWGLICAERIIPESKIKHEDVLKELIKSLDCFYDEKLASFVKSPSERIIDLEVALGINVLFESGLNIFNNREKILRVFSTLEKIEKELCFKINGIKIPIRYKEDFWNGEYVGSKGNCRPWPMGSAIISQAYFHLSEASLKIEDYELFWKALKNAKRWLRYARLTPNIENFPEQIDYDGSLPKSVPRPLTWCAAEVLKAERIFYQTKEKYRPYPKFYLN